MKNKLLAALLSLTISFGLWLYVVIVISPESEATFYNVPVKMSDTYYLDSNDLMIISDTSNLKVNLTLSGNRSDLNKLSSSNITVTADLSKIKSAGKHQIDCDVSIQSGSADVITKDPEQITVEVVKRESKTVPVLVYYTSVPEGYEVDKEGSYFSRTTVEVTGPKDAIDKVDHARITINAAGQMSSFPVNNCQLVLYGADAQPLLNTQYITMDESKISGTVRVNKVKEVTVYFDLDYTDSGLSQEEGMVTINPMKVTILGNDESLAKVDSTYRFVIQLKDYEQSTEKTFALPLPEGVTCKTEIKVQIPIPEMETISKSVGGDVFELLNRPQGTDIQVTGLPQVKVYGPKDVLDHLDWDEVRIVMDCAEVKSEADLSSATYLLRVGDKFYNYLRISVSWSRGSISITNTET